MAKIDDLIAQVENSDLRDRLATEVAKLNKQKKFGLVFEEHLPECTPLYEVALRRDCKAARMGENGKLDTKTIYRLLRIRDGIALCIADKDTEPIEIPVEELVTVAEFGDPIYPQLIPMDSVVGDPDNDLWHTLIQADNYHALQLLTYLYAGKVDCIYIDPPYNTGARDWKYNNDYVDSSDSYRHSKWLSMMEKRLKLAKKLLNPKDSVLIVTIDEKEYLHLGCLLEEMFSEANIQMISTRINATGIVRLNEFTRVDEYIYFVMLGESKPLMESVADDSAKPVLWHGLWRRDIESARGTKKGGVAQFYPIYVNNETCKIEEIGEPLPPDVPKETVKDIAGCTAVFPLKPDGTEMNWGLIGEVLKKRIEKGYVRVKRRKKGTNTFTIEYLTSGYINDIESGKAIIKGYDEGGAVIAEYPLGSAKQQAFTQWNDKNHYSKENGTSLLRKVIGDKRFNFPKSLYAAKDTIRFFVANKPNALIVDFFAGSGTTLHAVNLLNAEGGGHRRCIMVTNNEVSESEAKALTEQGYKPGDKEWEKLGIAQYVTWPRTVCSIEGHDVNGKPLKGNYIGSDIPMADGFKANAAFFKLGFLDKNAVALGRQFKELLPILWMKAGAVGKMPSLEMDDVPDMLILPENKFAVLANEVFFEKFEEKVNALPEIETVYIITNYEPGYRNMISGLKTQNTYQLYRDYLDNFRINTGRN